jgi:hypothetical protein
MDKHRKSRGLIVGLVLLLLSLLYVGSYLALVVPEGFMVYVNPHEEGGYVGFVHYRLGAHRIETFYRPLEDLDRKLRPLAWHPPGEGDGRFQ